MDFVQGWESGYDYVCEISDGLIPVRNGCLWGFVNDQGKIIIPFVYTMVWEFRAGLAPVKKDGLWGFINKTGKVVIDFQYDFVYPSGTTSFTAKKDNTNKIIPNINIETTIVINIKLSIISPPLFYTIKY